MSTKRIGIVVPLLDEAESLPELHSWIARVCQEHNMAFELLLIDDGSTDNSWEVIGQLSDQDSRVRGLRFSRNYGKSAALDVGFQRIGECDVVVTLDADLQDSPDELPQLYHMIMNQGFDLVSGWKKVRHDPLGKTLPSKVFNWLTRKISGIRLRDFNSGLKAYRYVVVKNIRLWGEMHRYIPFIAKERGFARIGEKAVEHYPRKYGRSKFGLGRMKGMLDLISLAFVSRFRRKPMHFFGSLGVLSFLIGGLIAAYVIGVKLYRIWVLHSPGREVVDQPLFFLALVAVIIGVQLFLAGFLGEMFTQTSQRPVDEYLIIEDTAEEA